MGAGRSGTTLLDIVLGNQNTMFSCGEINRFAIRNGNPPLVKDQIKLKFWRKIKNDMQITDYNYIIKLANSFEYHIGFAKSLFYKHKIRYKDYINYLSVFFKALFSNINNDCIIDSSKYPGRLFQLRNLPYDIKVIYLIREPSFVLKSFEKKDIEQPNKNWLFALIYYLLFCIQTLFFYCHLINLYTFQKTIFLFYIFV